MAVLGRKLSCLIEKLGIIKKLARRGCFAVCTGEERERHKIPVEYMNSRILQVSFDQCRDQSDKCEGLYLSCLSWLLHWVLELAKAEVEETGPNLAIKRDGIIHTEMPQMRSFSNYIVVV